MRILSSSVAAALALLLVFAGCERKTTTTNEIVKEISPADAAYIGSKQCETCHAETYASFRRTGHPYKLNDADSAQLPLGQYYPFSEIKKPSDLSWSDIDLVIGGFWWKARFIDTAGFIFTGANRQYNLATDGFVAYDSASAPKKPYNCGPCHMTNYNPNGNQNNEPGLVGTWSFNGVQCEECHGPGELHAADPYKIAMKIDRSSEACGKCHVRGDVEKIPASSGFVKHHEQWNELFQSKHASLNCVDCHDPHIGLHPNNPERDAAIRLKCESCHLEQTQSFLASPINHAGSSSGPDCITCHMPKAAKSAVGNLANFTGDVHSHQFRINTDPTAEMFTSDGKYANGSLTLDYVCLQCHNSKDKQWAATYAGSIHSASAADSITYAGSKACEACHPTIYANFRNTGHPYKLNDADSAQLPIGQYYPYTSVPNPADLSWDSISMVIGGFWWKARYIDNNGQIYTGPDRQYNFSTSSFVAYDGSSPGKKDYTCGGCHTTGYKATGNQNGLPGLIGTWAFNGVQCEECHGPGSAHIADAYRNPLKIDRSAEACGECHVRGTPSQIPAKGGFVKHHEQWNEMYTTKHVALECVDCHDPHIGLHPNNPDRTTAIKRQCEDCHLRETITFQATTITKHISNPGGPTCIDCHMPRSAKSAVGDLATFTGDIRSHVFRINTDSLATMWNTDSTLSNGYLTVDYACLHCHTTETKGWAGANSVNAHNAAAAPKEPRDKFSKK